jgi:hypothetical protein
LAKAIIDRLAYKTGLRLASFRFIRSAIDDHADLAGFGSKMIMRLVFGLLLIAVSNAVCWPLIGVVTGMSVHLKKPLIAIIGAPAVYIIAFICCGVGMAMAGGKGARIFLRWRARVWTEWLLSHGTQV